MNKGFTLIELLAVLVILGIIAVLTIPTIRDVLYESQDNAYNLIVKKIETRANDYVIDKKLDATITATNPVDVFLSQLLSENYITNKDLVDPRDEKDYIDASNSYVRFSLVDGELHYEANIVIDDN